MLSLLPYEEANGHTTVQFRWLEDEQLSEGDTKLEPTELVRIENQIGSWKREPIHYSPRQGNIVEGPIVFRDDDRLWMQFKDHLVQQLVWSGPGPSHGVRAVSTTDAHDPKHGKNPRKKRARLGSDPVFAKKSNT